MADISKLINEYAQMFYDRPEPFNTDDLHEIERISNRNAGGVTIALAAGYMQGYHDAQETQKGKKNMNKEFTVCGESLEELEYAAECVEIYMDKQIGNNVISYQLIGELKCMPWNSGYITDEDLEELQHRFVVADAVKGAQP